MIIARGGGKEREEEDDGLCFRGGWGRKGGGRAGLTVGIHVACEEHVGHVRVDSLHGFQHSLQEGDGRVAAQGRELQLVVGEGLAEVFALLTAVGVAAGALTDLVLV